MGDPPAADDQRTGPPPSSEPDPPETDSHPATAGDLRALRRWLFVAVAWAVAATAIAVIALIVANRAADDEESLRATEQIRQGQDELGGQLERLDARLGALPSADDVTALDDRLKQVEDDTSGLPGQVERVDGRLEALEARVDEVERRLNADGDAAADGNDTTP